MGEINYSTLLRSLVDQYFDNQMSRVEYLAQRRSLLESIDRDFNGDFAFCGVTPDACADQPDYALFPSNNEPSRQ